MNLHDELARVREDLATLTERYKESAGNQSVPEGRRKQHETQLAALSKRIVMLSHSEQQLSEIVAPDTRSDQDSQFDELQRHG